MERGERDRSPGQVARQLLECTYRGDLAAASALCTPDLELRLEGTQVLRGHEGLRQMMEFASDVASEVRLEIDRVLSAGDTAAISRTTFLTINGTCIELAVGSFFRVRDGLVCEWSDYQDIGELTRALGH